MLRHKALGLFGQGVSIRVVRERTGLSIGALHRLKSGATTVSSRPGAPTALPAIVEAQLVQILLHVSDAGVGLSWSKMSQVVRRVAAQLGHPRPDFVAGPSWMQAFLVRNPTLSKRLGKRASRARLVNFNRMTCAEWFGAMKPHLVGKHAFKAAEMYNLDDTSFDRGVCALGPAPGHCEGRR